MPYKVTVMETRPHEYVKWWMWSPEQLAIIKAGEDHIHEDRLSWEYVESEDKLSRTITAVWVSKEAATAEKDRLAEMTLKKDQYNEEVGILVEKKFEEI